MKLVQTLLQLTVKDILQRPLFQKAETIASQEALNRIVRWVHIMEVPHVGHLLNGHELILNTGIGWHDNEELSLSFLQQLIDSGASGLCIELGTYTKQPLERMKELALREHFPLIFFMKKSGILISPKICMLISFINIIRWCPSSKPYQRS